MHTRDKCNFTNEKLDLHIMLKLNKTALQLKRLDIYGPIFLKNSKFIKFKIELKYSCKTEV